LYVQTEARKRGTVARQRAPDVFENFVGVEKASAVEQVETFAEVSEAEVSEAGWRGHRGLASTDRVACPTICMISID
jgi:hypothetical protein